MKIKARFYTFEEWFKRVQLLANKEHVIIINGDLVKQLFDSKIDVKIAAADLIHWERLLESISPYSDYEDPE